VRAYFAKLRDLLNKQKAIGINYDDSQVLGKVINDLPDSFASFKTLFNMLSVKDSSFTMTLDEAEAQLVTIEKGPTLSNIKSDDQAALSSGARRNNNSNRTKQQQTKQDKPPRKFCNYCKKNGHLLSQCFSLKRKQTQPPSDTALSATLTLAEGKYTKKWFADTGASYHTTFEREYFSDYKEIDYHDEILTAKGLLKVHGIGTIKCKFWNGETWR